MDTPTEFRAKIKAKYAIGFTFFEKVAATFEKALDTPRGLHDEVARVLDMFMYQAYKAHGSVYILGVRAHVEDAATITRRLLEIAIQAIFIGAAPNRHEARQRAGAYLADLWDSLPVHVRATLPPEECATWDEYLNRYGHLLDPNRIRWGPSFRKLFAATGVSETYDEDYKLLSSIAHGSPPALVHAYAENVVNVHPDDLVPMILLFASRYYLAVAE